jgi:peptidoglycan/LPS O-acetylase OafA/YrhL
MTGRISPLMYSRAIDHAIYKTTKRFDSLNGWRAVAILAVIWHHSLANVFTSPLAYEGRHGVSLFFVISGFLIVTLLLREQQQNGTISLTKFWGRRCLRILPVYYGTLLLYILIVGLFERSEAGQDFFRHLPFFATFTTNWFVTVSDRTIFYFSWSVAAEEQFYLVWPLIEVLVKRRLHKLLLLVCTMVVSQYAFVRYGFSTHADLLPLSIVLGTILAHLLDDRRSFQVIYAILGRRGSAFGCLAFAVAALLVEPAIGIAGEMLTPVAFALLIASCVIREDNDLAQMLQWRPLAWIGTVSYGMYMIHMLWINIARGAGSALHIGSPALDFVGGVAIAVALASVSFIFFERPLLAFKTRLFSPTKQAPVKQPVAA